MANQLKVTINMHINNIVVQKEVLINPTILDFLHGREVLLDDPIGKVMQKAILELLHTWDQQDANQ